MSAAENTHVRPDLLELADAMSNGLMWTLAVLELLVPMDEIPASQAAVHAKARESATAALNRYREARSGDRYREARSGE